jgi:hypothetical protein
MKITLTELFRDVVTIDWGTEYEETSVELKREEIMEIWKILNIR